MAQAAGLMTQRLGRNAILQLRQEVRNPEGARARCWRYSHYGKTCGSFHLSGDTLPANAYEVVQPMTNEWRDLSDERLAEIAQGGMQGQGAPVEAMRQASQTLALRAFLCDELLDV
jgi:hypothetical protein